MQSQRDSGGYVYFYASQSNEGTLEKRMPGGDRSARHFGVFTFTLARILSAHPGISYRQAGERVLQLAAQNLLSVTPLFVGNKGQTTSCHTQAWFVLEISLP